MNSAANSKDLPKTKNAGLPPLIPVKDGKDMSHQFPLGERALNCDSVDGLYSPRPSPFKAKTALHKKTKSAVSLKSLRNYMDRKEHKSGEYGEDGPGSCSPKRAKSSNSLSAILKLSQRSRKGGPGKDVRDKENHSPIELSDNEPSPTQFHYQTDYYGERGQGPQAMEAGLALEMEVSLYTPKEYGPSQQRNFYDYNQYPLTRRLEGKSRPKSDCLPGYQNVQHKLAHPQRTVSDQVNSQSEAKRSVVPQEDMKAVCPFSANLETGDKRNSNKFAAMSRVQAAISAYNAIGRMSVGQTSVHINDIETEFERLLDARNIPQNMRVKMRSLDTHIKADFINKHQLETDTSHNSNPNSSDNTRCRGRHPEQADDQQVRNSKSSRSRSRSRGFTFSKPSLSPSKKQRPDSGSSFRRPKSVDFSQPVGSFKVLKPSTSTTSLSAAACHDTASDPSDFVHYLREIQRPEMMDVGKLHKLRLLLRNETVSWVDVFISDGGMDEIVQLIYRIMKVEWREEHEDNLLREALLCLKGLCTTSAALKQLTAIESELFPALLKMLFDEEKKGPSEFTTRGIIINLLFTQLSSALTSSTIAAEYALRILSYIRDPEPPEDDQPPSFIANIYQSRPYRVWCKEVTNVTKEVFWIFLHQLNLIPVTKLDKRGNDQGFLQRHFPLPRPPVPAAPYVGGVEWDATNYLAAHLDLMNGLIASLPTADQRNQLRTELRASGFEKVMGGNLRTCKEKFYSAVHDCLRTWVAAAAEDGWPYTLVREGPPRLEPGSPGNSPIKAAPLSPKKSPVGEKAPKLELVFDDEVVRSSHQERDFDNWL